MLSKSDRFLLGKFIWLIFCCSVIQSAVLDFDEWLENPSEYFSTHLVAFNLSRDAKRSPYNNYSPGGHAYGRPHYGYGGYGHYYRPYYKPQKMITTTTEPPPPLECGTGPYHGGPPLVCMLRTECIAQGGLLGEPCGRGFSRGFCCEFPQQIGCGETTDAVHSLFRNPDYPDTTSKPFSCSVGIIPRPEACGIRLEFLDSVMGQSVDGYCYQDTFTVLGGGSLEDNGFNTPFCGIIKGYGTVIPVNQTSELVLLVVNSQSRNVLWNINVTQIHCASLYLPFDDLCGVRNARLLQSNESLPINISRSEESETTPFPVPPGPVENVGKIIGGANLISSTGVTQFPWMAAIFYDNVITCGGTLIARQFVLTAAHCVTYYAADSLIPIKRFRVRLGSYNLNLLQTPTNSERLRVVRKLLRIYVHPEYEGSNFDLAVLKLNETVIYNAAIRPVCFPEDPDEPYTRFRGTIMGWGSIGGATRNNPTLLGSNNVLIVSNDACQTAWTDNNVFIRDSMICAGNGAAAICTVDSGGPLLVQEEDGLWSLVGVSSFGAPPQCGNPDFPDVYSRVTTFVSWIALVLAIPLPDF